MNCFTIVLAGRLTKGFLFPKATKQELVLGKNFTIHSKKLGLHTFLLYCLFLRGQKTLLGQTCIPSLLPADQVFPEAFAAAGCC